MIRVTIELVSARTSRTSVLARANIWNTGEGTRTKGHYRFTLFDKAGRPWRQGEVRDFPRKRLLAWDLLHRCLSVLEGR